MPPNNKNHPLGIPDQQQPGVHKRLVYGLIGLLFLMFVMIGLIIWRLSSDQNVDISKKDSSKTVNNSSISKSNPQVTEGLRLDTTKQYGNKYADGILPVGDSKYTTSTAKKGYVYLCNANFVPAGQAGAQTRGPWFMGTDKWDLNKKVSVSGSVNWTATMTNKVDGETRIISTNDLPTHITGQFPVDSTDPAYPYDRNPNSIKSQNLTYNLKTNPSYGSPHCMRGEAGILLTGSALFNAFDAGGRDAGAWEVQDGCSGHPQSAGEYHYHTLSSCITDISIKSVLGFALDGFAITGPKVSDGNLLTTEDLDECHGITSEITLDGKKTTTYHYVMTQDFPYSVSCFRSIPIDPPGIHENSTQGSQPTQPKQPPSRP